MGIIFGMFSNVIEILEEHSLVKSITNILNYVLLTGQGLLWLRPHRGVFLADNLLDIIVLSWFHRCDHHTVVLIGGAIARVDDISGKFLERLKLDPLSLEKNNVGISNTVERIQKWGFSC